MEKEYEEEITRLFLLYYRRLLLYAKSVLHDDYLAEEVVQEVFRIACQKPEVLCSEVDNQLSWLATVLRRVISNTRRSQTIADASIADYYTVYQDRNSARTELEPDILYGDISETGDYKLVKAVMEGNSIAELAKSEGVSYSVLQKRLSRARIALQKIIRKIL